jgi:hypothetical protein
LTFTRKKEKQWLSFMSLHTFLFYCYSCWIDCLLLKFGSYIIFIRPQNIWGHIMVWRSRRRLCTFCFGLYNFYRLNRKAVFFILLIDNFTVIWFVQCPSHIFYIINCHAKHETEDLHLDIHPGLGVLATGN